MKIRVVLRNPEALKSQFGLFGTFATQARAANPGGAWGGAPASGTHVELRTDSTGRTEHRVVRDGQPGAGHGAGVQTPPPAAHGPVQADIFGGWSAAQPAPLAPPQKTAPAPAPNRNACVRCGGKMGNGKAGRVCDPCVRTVDLREHPSFSHLFG